MYVVYLKTSPKRDVVWCNPSFHSFKAERRHALAPNIEQYSFPLLESEYGSHVGFAYLRVFSDDACPSPQKSSRPSSSSHDDHTLLVASLTLILLNTSPSMPPHLVWVPAVAVGPRWAQ